MAEPYRTMAEIYDEFPNEWVLLDRPTLARDRSVTGGHVIWHHPELEAFDARLMDFLRPHTARLFTRVEPLPEFGELHILEFHDPDSPTQVDTIIFTTWNSDSTPG